MKRKPDWEALCRRFIAAGAEYAEAVKEMKDAVLATPDDGLWQIRASFVGPVYAKRKPAVRAGRRGR